MGLLPWLQQFWFELIQSAAPGVELLTRRRERVYQSISNRIMFTQRHGELWRRYASDPELHRVKSQTPDLSKTPLFLKEHQFVSEVVHHFSDCFVAYDQGVFRMPEAIGTDVRSFFSLPIPKLVWEDIKRFQDRKFVGFVETYLRREEF